MLIAKQSRQALFNLMQPNSIAIIWGKKLQYRNHDVEYLFRQDSNFYYLTAFAEPQAVAVFIKLSNNEQQFILFSRTKNPGVETWSGPIVGQQLAVEVYGADLAYDILQIDNILPGLLKDKTVLYYPLLQEAAIENNLLTWRKLSVRFPKIIQDLSDMLFELRIIKSDLELKNIRYATEISAKAHEYIMYYVANNKPLTEKQLQAEFQNYCLKQGAADMAYPPIVAAGANACILHYNQNSAALKSGDLLLLDAGAEYNYYAADITRTFPINGKFTGLQKDLYSLVLLAQSLAIKQIKPGLLWSELQQKIVLCITQGLIDLKILTGDVNQLVESGAYKKFYMHSSGHFLGIDVHDPSAYKINDQYRSLLPGMVLTVEPGIYLREYGIGIRIEDDILVTNDGYEVLTSFAIKNVDDIEYFMKNK